MQVLYFFSRQNSETFDIVHLSAINCRKAINSQKQSFLAHLVIRHQNNGGFCYSMCSERLCYVEWSTVQLASHLLKLCIIDCTEVMFVFACRGPYVFVNYGIGVIIYESLLTVFVISNFGLATFMDPGMYPQGLPVLTLNIKKNWKFADSELRFLWWLNFSKNCDFDVDA